MGTYDMINDVYDVGAGSIDVINTINDAQDDAD